VYESNGHLKAETLLKTAHGAQGGRTEKDQQQRIP
jgi:hypothetical protein